MSTIFRLGVASQDVTPADVTNLTQLTAALSTATSGQIIRCAGGSYDTLNISNTTYPGTGPIIRSANPGNPAIFTGGRLTNVANLTLDTILVQFPFTANATSWLMHACTNVNFLNSTFNGALNPGGYGFGAALSWEVSSGMTVDNNHFSHWGDVTMGFNTCDNFNVTNNEITLFNGDGIDNLQITFALFENNFIHDSHVDPTSGVHIDGLQMFSTGALLPSHDITVRGNFISSGGTTTGEVNELGLFQSIFMRNEVVDGGSPLPPGKTAAQMFYSNLLFENNVIFNAQLLGISVGETNNITVQHNTLLQNKFTAQLNGDYTQNVYIPSIDMAKTSTACLLDNNIVGGEFSQYQTGGGAAGDRPGTTVTNNLLVQNSNPGAPANYYGNLFVNAMPANGIATLNDLKTTVGSVIDTTGVGSILTQP